MDYKIGSIFNERFLQLNIGVKLVYYILAIFYLFAFCGWFSDETYSIFNT
jgi:hypothetical protein